MKMKKAGKAWRRGERDKQESYEADVKRDEITEGRCREGSCFREETENVGKAGKKGKKDMERKGKI
jgi:hypothetical protein